MAAKIKYRDSIAKRIRNSSSQNSTRATPVAMWANNNVERSPGALENG
jgi:hypothetical protein